MVPQFFEKKWPFCPQIKKKKLRAVFREALIVPLLLDFCLDIFGAWINKKNCFRHFYFENKSIFGKKKKGGGLTQSFFFVMDLIFTTKHFP